MDDSVLTAPHPSPPDTDETSQPGPVFDTAVRECLRTGLAAFLPLVGEVDVGLIELLPTSLPAAKLTADVVARVGHAEAGSVRAGPAGAGRLVHLEIERDGTRKIVARMFNYRAALMNDYPDQRINQHIIVLGHHNVPGFAKLPRLGVNIPLRLTHLRDVDPSGLLTRPDLAPMAVLARGDYAQRSASYAAALRVIRGSGGSRVSELTGYAARLATIRLDPSTIRSISKEAGMTMDQYIEMWRGDVVAETYEARGQARGEARGRAVMLATLLQDRFGHEPDLQAVAERLAAWPNAIDALHAVTSATTLDDVRSAQPPIA